MSCDPLSGAELARWCYENPNLAALTIEGLRAGPAATPTLDDEDQMEKISALSGDR